MVTGDTAVLKDAMVRAVDASGLADTVCAQVADSPTLTAEGYVQMTHPPNALSDMVHERRYGVRLEQVIFAEGGARWCYTRPCLHFVKRNFRPGARMVHARCTHVTPPACAAGIRVNSNPGHVRKRVGRGAQPAAASAAARIARIFSPYISGA